MKMHRLENNNTTFVTNRRTLTSVEMHEVQFVFLYSTAIKNDFNLYDCIIFGFSKFRAFRVLSCFASTKRRPTFWKTSEMEWNVMLMVNAYDYTIRYVPADSTLTHLKNENIYLFSSLVLIQREVDRKRFEEGRKIETAIQIKLC